MHDSPLRSSPHKRQCLLRALALASLAIAGITLSLAWDFLASIDSMPKMLWLQQMLAQVPAASWLLMFVWGFAIPLVLLLSLQQTPIRKLRTTALMLALMWLAITWYVHMPASSQCDALYSSWGWACSVLQWGFSMSLLLAIAAYAFLMLGLIISALGQLAEGMESDPNHAA